MFTDQVFADDNFFLPGLCVVVNYIYSHFLHQVNNCTVKKEKTLRSVAGLVPRNRNFNVIAIHFHYPQVECYSNQFAYDAIFLASTSFKNDLL